MKKIKEVEQELLRLQYEDNEQRTNRIVAVISLFFVVICFITHIILLFHYTYVVYALNTYIFMPLSVTTIIIDVIAWSKRFKGAWIKYMLLFNIIIICTTAYLSYPTYMSFCILVPIVISANYFKTRLVLYVSVIMVVLSLASSILNLTLESRFLVVHELHEYVANNIWKYPIDALSFLVIPSFIVFLFLTIYNIYITSNGHRLINAQVKSTERVTAFETELNMAWEIQKSVLPESSFTTRNGLFNIQAKEISAREVCGDFYDYFMVNDYILAFLIADVSDKGASAAMFMMSAKKVIQCAVQYSHTLDDAIHFANKMICEDNKCDMFLTLWLGLIDVRSGEGKYINAGHLPPIIRHADGNTTIMDNEPDLFLGNFPEITPKTHLFSLKPGDALLLYTDGLTDAMSTAGTPFGTNALISAAQNAGSAAQSVIHDVLESVKKFTNGTEQFDDITLLVLKCNKIQPPERMEIEASADTAGTKTIIDGIDSLLKKLCCPDDTRRNACVVADEICANIADYAYGSFNGRMRVRAVAGANFVDIDFIDNGTEFNPLEYKEPVFSDEPSIGGLGIFFVKNLVDRMTYRRESNENILSIKMIWDM